MNPLTICPTLKSFQAHVRIDTEYALLVEIELAAALVKN